MSQHKYIHPRNIYKTPPDYTELAIKHPEFRKLCKLNLDGTVSINLKSEICLIALTKTLLREDFDLNIEFAPNSLIPTVPLRLNYLLWIEDIVNEFKLENIHGIDIGCGSSCIYSLLAAKKFKWSIDALEANKTNIEFANENIERNNLGKLVKVFEQKDNAVIFENLFATIVEDLTYDFCLCNPPFFDLRNKTDENMKGSNRSSHRKKPKNCHTGKDDELFCDGGEVNFVQKIIDESLKFKSRVRIFTTMLGHKTSANAIAGKLQSLGISNFTETSFCQGNTTRWGIAWTFYNNFNLKNVRYIKLG